MTRRRKYGNIECSRCGKAFLQVRPGAKYCSLACSAGAQRLAWGLRTTKTCTKCGRTLPIGDFRDARHKQPCRECHSKLERARYVPSQRPSANCKRCGKEIIRRTGRHEFCSPECRYLATYVPSSGRRKSGKSREEMGAAKREYSRRHAAERRADPITGPAIKAADRKRLEAWRASHPEKVKEMQRHQRRKKDAVRRARRGTKQPSQLTSLTVPTRKDWLAILKNFGTRCAYCDTPLAKPTGGKHQADNEESLDHFVPLATGGAHDKSNAVPACRKCNIAKNAKEPRAWMQDEERYQFVCDMRSLNV